MELSDITTVQDLLDANTKPDPVKQVFEDLEDVRVMDNLKIAKVLLENLQDWHMNIAGENMNDLDTATVWIQDAGKLEAALDILNTIVMPGDLDDNEDDN